MKHTTIGRWLASGRVDAALRAVAMVGAVFLLECVGCSTAAKAPRAETGSADASIHMAEADRARLRLMDAFTEAGIPGVGHLLRDWIERRDYTVSKVANGMRTPSCRCLVVDTVLARPSGTSRRHVTMLVADLDAKSSIQTPGEAVRVRPEEWRFLEPYLERAFARQPPPIRQGASDVAVLTYFDGRSWRRQVWIDPRLRDDRDRDFAAVMALTQELARGQAGLECDFFDLEDSDLIDGLRALKGNAATQ